MIKAFQNLVTNVTEIKNNLLNYFCLQPFKLFLPSHFVRNAVVKFRYINSEYVLNYRRQSTASCRLGWAILLQIFYSCYHNKRV